MIKEKKGNGQRVDGGRNEAELQRRQKLFVPLLYTSSIFAALTLIAGIWFSIWSLGFYTIALIVSLRACRWSAKAMGPVGMHYIIIKVVAITLSAFAWVYFLFFSESGAMIWDMLVSFLLGPPRN